MAAGYFLFVTTNCNVPLIVCVMCYLKAKETFLGIGAQNSFPAQLVERRNKMLPFFRSAVSSGP